MDNNYLLDHLKKEKLKWILVAVDCLLGINCNVVTLIGVFEIPINFTNKLLDVLRVSVKINTDNSIYFSLD